MECHRKLRLYFFRLLPAAVTSLTGEASELSQQTLPVPAEKLVAPAATEPGFSAVDWLAIHLAKKVHVLSVRAGGQIERALKSRLQLRAPLMLDVRLLDEPQLTAPAISQTLCHSGAIRWTPCAAKTCSADKACFTKTAQLQPTANAAILLPSEQPPSERFLFHWTRSPPLNRRRESDRSILQLLDRMPTGHGEIPPTNGKSALLQTPLRTLLEIVTSGMILASGRWTADNRPVVSLTAQPLERWPELHRYRPHLGRWDFEFFGVALLRERISELGGRPVIYGGARVRLELCPDELAWFQQASTRRNGSNIDWTIEQEWRVPGDIDLRGFGPSDAFLFVSSRNDAETISPFSRWPILVFDP